MRLQHLISTIDQKDFGFIRTLNCKEDIIVVNQRAVNNESFTLESDDKTVTVINSTQTGLSNSRNQLLLNATGDVCIIGDDDVVYRENYNYHIRRAYQDYPGADIIVFRFSEDATKDTRIQFRRPRVLNLFNISKVASIEITFKRSSILNAGIQFDTLLGLGAELNFGEENAFLADALRQKLVIQYVPITICHSIPRISRQKQTNGYDKTYFQNKGAVFCRIYGKYWILFAFAFVILKSNTVFKSVNCVKALYWISHGSSIYQAATKRAQR